MRILITGGLGYIGQTLSKYLRVRGHIISIIDKDETVKQAPIDGGNRPYPCCLIADVNDLQTIHFKPELELDAVVHLAAMVGHRRCDANMELAERDNVSGTASVAYFVKSRDIPVVYASTGAIYGVRSGTVADENTKPHPRSYYAATKFMGEKYVLDAGGCVLRLNHVCGVSPRMTWEQFVNAAARDAAKGDLTIYDPDKWRPGTHIEDICRAFELALIRSLRGIYDCVGVNHVKGEVGEIAEACVPGLIVKREDRGIDINDYLVAGEKLYAEGFRPEHGIERGFREALDVAATS